ncbi:MAG: uroporphyrinogen decarboxylase family protein, partial [Candidatus Latescibacteria bacterium]|nr:uroporphyrinogen decarboxylase family protein [Candidatus Latescibacterota bacterium]
ANSPYEHEFEFLCERAAYLRKYTDKAFILTGLGWWGLGMVGSIPEALMLLATDPGYVHDLLDLRCELATANLRRAYDALGDLIDIVVIDGQDFGSQRAEMFNPERFQEFFAPRFAKQVDWIHSHTPWKVWQHSCGSIPNLLPQIVDAGIDAINPIQTSAAGMEPEVLKTRFGQDITFWGGGVDTQRTLPFGTPDEVHQQVKERIKTFAPGGGFVFAAVHNIQANTPPSNIEAMFDAVRTHGTYPIA